MLQIARRQSDLVRRDQVLACGMSDDAIRHRIGPGGRWRRVLPGVYATVTGELSERQRLVAALLFAGSGAMLGCATALRLFGLKYLPNNRSAVHVLIPHSRQLSGVAFVVFHRTTKLPRARSVFGFPVCPPARAIIDTCREMTNLRDVRALLLEAVQRRIVRLAQLEQALAAGAKSRTALVRRAISDGRAGCRSAPEAELRDILKRSKILPKILWNVPVFDRWGYLVGTPDGWIEEVGLALQVDSREHHAEALGGEDTQRRDNRYDRAGIPSLAFTPWRIRNEPDQVLREVEEAYLEWRERRTAERAVRGASA